MDSAINEKPKMDAHFYIDNAPPIEVTQILRIMGHDSEFTNQEIAEIFKKSYGFEMQRDHTYSPRRLCDLGLFEKKRTGSRETNNLTDLGKKLQNILGIDISLAFDLLHYLHYTRYENHPNARKYFWSYKRCCELIWEKGFLIKPDELAAIIQVEMKQEFPMLDFNAKKGGRFNAVSAGCVSTWLRALIPSPITKPGELIQRRLVQRFELSLLALSYVYQIRGYQYGDPVLMDRQLIDQISGVFFLNGECCSNLLRMASRISSLVKLSDTLSGTSITLLKPFTINDV